MSNSLNKLKGKNAAFARFELKPLDYISSARSHRLTNHRCKQIQNVISSNTQSHVTATAYWHTYVEIHIVVNVIRCNLSRIRIH